MKEIVVVILVIYFYNTSQHGLVSANDKSIEKNGPSKTDITENNERTFYMGHRRPLYFDRKQRAEKYKFPHQIRRLNTKFDKPRMEGGIISRKHALPGARNRNHCSKMNRFPLVTFPMACDADRDWRIVNGSKASEGQFPYQVSLRWNDVHFCGGSILNEQWVLTAAHCVKGYITDYLGDVTVVTGTNSLLSGGNSYKVTHSIVHSGFDRSHLHNDIALFKINGTIAFNAKVQPIPLETRHVGAGEDVVVSGWGLTSYPGKSSNNLLFLDTKAINNKICNKIYARSGDSVVDTQLCTLTQRGQGMCEGDSGGPLAHNGKLVGIASCVSGEGCAKGYPDIFTRVSSYVDWINYNMHWH